MLCVSLRAFSHLVSRDFLPTSTACTPCHMLSMRLFRATIIPSAVPSLAWTTVKRWNAKVTSTASDSSVVQERKLKRRYMHDYSTGLRKCTSKHSRANSCAALKVRRCLTVVWLIAGSEGDAGSLPSSDASSLALLSFFWSSIHISHIVKGTCKSQM